MKMNETMKRAGAITALSLLIVAILIPTAIAPPPTITVKSSTGVEDENGVKLLGNGAETSDLVQLVNASSDPHSHICYIRIGSKFSPDDGNFSHDLGLESGTKIYCRAWNAPSYEQASCSGDSITLTTVGGVEVYDFGTWQTNTCDPEPEPPVPDLPAIILFGVGLLVITGYFCLRSKRK